VCHETRALIDPPSHNSASRGPAGHNRAICICRSREAGQDRTARNRRYARSSNSRAVAFRDGFGDLPRWLRPALDSHDDAAAEAQLGADEPGVAEQAVTHAGQSRPELLIFVAGEVHVVHDQDAATAERGHGLVQPGDLPARRIREYQVKLAEAADGPRPVA
jgi:hypothetical protein